MLEVLKMQKLLKVVSQILDEAVFFIRIIWYFNKYQFELVWVLLQIPQHFFITTVFNLYLRIYIYVLSLKNSQKLVFYIEIFLTRDDQDLLADFHFVCEVLFHV